MVTTLIESYNRINNSFKEKSVYKIGSEAGFFSEYNNMILYMLYCLDHKIKFSLSSQKANFKIRNGWCDFFIPFCPEAKDGFNVFFSKRPNKRFNLKVLNYIDELFLFSYKKMYHTDYLMSDLWYKVREQELNKIYTIPELNISGNLRSACQQLINMTWIYNKEVEERVNNLKEQLNLPADYIGFHIRSGDKFVEAKQQDIHKYIEKAKTLTEIKNAFVLTDDYGTIEGLRSSYPGWRFFTLCKETERGYFHKQFSQQKSEAKYNQLINLFTSIDLLSASSFFIGTFSSNPGMYLGMRMDPTKTFSIDIPDWIIW